MDARFARFPRSRSAALALYYQLPLQEARTSAEEKAIPLPITHGQCDGSIPQYIHILPPEAGSANTP